MNKLALSNWRKKQLEKYGITKLYYASLIDNAQSIIKYGILSKNEATSRKIKFASFADEDVQERRDIKEIDLSNQNTVAIHDCVPLYLNLLTPTLYKIKKRWHEIFVVVINAMILTDSKIEFTFTDGNAASKQTIFHRDLRDLSCLPWNVINADSWTEFEDGKRKRNSEFLIYPSISPIWFDGFIVNNEHSNNKLNEILLKNNLNRKIIISKNFS